MPITKRDTSQRTRTVYKAGRTPANLLMSVTLRKRKQLIFPSRGSKIARGCHSKSKGLRWQIFGSSQPPAFLLSEDHFNICMLFLLEAPVGAVVAVWAPGRTKGRKRNKSIPSRTAAITEMAQMGNRYQGTIINSV